MSSNKRKATEVLFLSDSDDDAPPPPFRKKHLSPPVPPQDQAQPTRLQLEQERRARQEQREAAGLVAPTTLVRHAVGRSTVQTISDIVASESPSVTAVASSSSSSVHGFGRTTSAGATQARSRASQRYWSGALVRCACSRYPDQDSLDFDQVVGVSPKPSMAIIAAYVMDIEWILDRLQGEYPLMLVSKRGILGKPGGVVTLDASVRPKTFGVVPQEKMDYGAMHVKCFVVYYETFCRLCIPTANAISYDWGTLENAMYIHDFPKLSLDPERPFKARDNPTHTAFTRAIYDYLSFLGCGDKFLSQIAQYDFSSSGNVQLITSRQGWYTGWDDIEQAGGIASLARGVSAFHPSPGGYWEIEATGSSMGDLSGDLGTHWLRQMLAACSGIAPRSYFTSKSRSLANLPTGPSELQGLPIKIVFPTLQEIDDSFGGRPGGGTLFFPGKLWNNKNWPSHLLFRGQSKRKGIIAHTKHIVALHKPGLNPPLNFKHEGWIYTGSHNFTPSAWGKLSQRAGQPPKLCLANYEMGVLQKIEGRTEAEVEAKASAVATYKRPLVPYSAKDEPWQQDVYLRGSDSDH